MIFQDLTSFLKDSAKILGKGPIALVLLEDEVEVDSTLRHHVNAGFKNVVAVGVADIAVDPKLSEKIIRVHHDMLSDNAVTDVVNGVIPAVPDRWIFYCFNAEYLFFPFCESRSIGEMTAFCAEERRASMLTYVIDLYAGDLSDHPSAVSIPDAHLDKSGYYALARSLPGDGVAERQLDFFGGLRWRFEEHIPQPRRRIDRIALFRAKPGLKLRPNHTFNDEEYNTYACPWHHSPTGALCSFRTAKALKRNPGSTHDIQDFRWHNSTQFQWNSQQLLDLGLMEPGQWF